MTADVAATDFDARLQRARSIDWRFALPDPTPGNVALVGVIDPDVAAAFEDAGWHHVSSGADLAVVDGPSPVHLSVAALAVRPGGWLYVACRGPASGRLRRRRLSPRVIAARLAAMGFGEVRMQLHVPGFRGRSAIVPLEEPAALALLLRRRGGLAGTRPMLAFAGWLTRRGWLARLAPGVSVLAQRDLGPGATTAAARDAISSHLDVLRTADQGLPIPAPLSTPLLLTPSFRASRHVVGLVPDTNGRWVELVAKVARLPDSGDVTRREAAGLELVAGRRGAARGGAAPRLVAIGTPWGLPTIVETAVDGQPLNPAAVRREPEAVVDAVVAWLADLAEGAVTAQPGRPAADRLSRLLDAPLLAFEAAMPLTPEERDLLARTRELVEPLRSVTMPAVIEHGDASHPNLLRRPDGGVAAVDWELAEPDGLPAHDLITFLAYVATARATARTPDAQATAIATALTDPDGWAQAAAVDYAERTGLDAGCLGPLTAVALARLTIGLLERLHDGPVVAVAPATADWLRTHRYFAAWRAVVAAQGAAAVTATGSRS